MTSKQDVSAIRRPLRSTPWGLYAAAAGALSFAGTAAAQGVGNEWVEFHRENTRIQAQNAFGIFDQKEKDYAWGDLDKDGWIDLVVARKQPFTTTGRERNVLFMNVDGVLTDMTMTYANTSTVGGDTGMLTPTNDRDVAIADVDGDTWPDVITATTLSAGQPKHISHPRIYMNQGEDGSGN